LTKLSQNRKHVLLAHAIDLVAMIMGPALPQALRFSIERSI